MTVGLSSAEETTIVATLTEELATAMGAGWSADEPDVEEPYQRTRYLLGPAAARIGVSLPWNKPDRVELHGALPRAPEGFSGSDLFHGHHPTTITCARSRGADAIAGEIRARLLPEYRKTLEACYTLAQTALKDHFARRRTAELLAMSFGSDYKPREPRDYEVYVRNEDGPWGSVKASYDDTVSIELHSVPLEVARSIGKLVRG